MRRLIEWVRERWNRRVEEAWQEGYRHADVEVEEFIAGKDAYIAEQAALIVALTGYVLPGDLPDDLYQRLRDYA